MNHISKIMHGIKGEMMNQSKQEINDHIKEYLNYYCGLSHSPGFAVLLQGQWGSGKTWFINKYRENFRDKNCKFLYISLYGMTSFSEIEYAFYQQLRPFFASKEMQIATKVLKSIVKISLKFDCDSDGRDDGTAVFQIPEVELLKYFKNIDKSILIFDDLERCSIDLSDLLGYINYFIEHQGLKVILVSNEDELLKNCANYKNIKEKLIGKTFGISLDFESALEDFITLVNQPEARIFLSENMELIRELYRKSKYENLRNLKQIVLDFERIFNAFPEKAKNKPEILQKILELLIAFSIEIKRGAILPREIIQLEGGYKSFLNRQIKLKQPHVSVEKGNDQELTPFQELFDRYSLLEIHDPFPNPLWWQIFFDKGIIDAKELEQSILSSRYFQDENTPDWIRLWYFSDLPDDKFKDLIKKVESDYTSRKYLEIGLVKHIFGLFLKFSSAGLYHKSRREILEDSKLYIDHLKDQNEFNPFDSSANRDAFGGYELLGYELSFQEKDSDEFKELSFYIDKLQELAREEELPNAGQILLATMQSDVGKFSRMICSTAYQFEDASEKKYREVPILKYIESAAFTEKLLLINSEAKQRVFYSLSKRYEFDGTNERLVEELEWLKSVQSLMLREINSRKGELSGFILDSLLERHLNKIVEILENKKPQAQREINCGD